MKRLRFTIAKNAIANLTRGGATAMVALVLPHFLTRSLDHDRFAAWSLMLQIAAYANYLDFGLQTAVARFLAQYNEGHDEEQKNCLLSTSVGLLSLAAVLALLIMGVVLWQLPRIFSGLPPSLLREFRLALLVLVASTIIQLPLSAFSGVLVGLHRNEYVAVSVGVSRVLGALLVVLVARQTQSLFLLSACVAAANLIGSVAQMLTVKRLLPGLRIARSYLRRATAFTLAHYCAGLTVWAFSAFLVGGIDVTMVGYFDYKAVGYYSIAASLVTFFAAADSAVCSALITPIAALHASGRVDRIRHLVLKATRLNTFVNVLAGAFLFLFGRPVLRMWVGEAYARQALPIVEILIIANVVRLIANPYASMLIATGQQKHGIAQGPVEGIVNFITSIALALWLGPIGVAVGTLIGAVCVLIWVCAFTLKWVTEPHLDRWHFVRKGVLSPLGCSLPFLAFVLFTYHRSLNSASAGVLASCSVLMFVFATQFARVRRLLT